MRIQSLVAIVAVMLFHSAAASADAAAVAAARKVKSASVAVGGQEEAASSLAASVAAAAASNGLDTAMFSFQESPFKDYIDYATWTQYLCQQLLLVGDMEHLEVALNRLSFLATRLPIDEAQIVRDDYWRLQTRVQEWRTANPAFRTNDDSDADRIFAILVRGHYKEAKAEMKSMLDSTDYMAFDVRLKNIMIVLGLVQYDGMNPMAMLPLWSPTWALSQDDMISALFRAKQLHAKASDGAIDPKMWAAFRPFDRITSIDARALSNLGRDVTGMLNEAYIQEDEAEKNLLKGNMAHMLTEYCKARDFVRNAASTVEVEYWKNAINTMADRLDEKCTRKQLDSTYRAFCQIGHESSFPISEAVYPSPQAAVVSVHERMFWTRIAVGDCEGAKLDLGQLSSLIPMSIMAQRTYLKQRFDYMKEKMGKCVMTPTLYKNEFGHMLMDHLMKEEFEEALTIWRQNFFFSPTSPDAETWRRALIVARYPKVTYAPCTGNSLLSGIASEDKDVLDRLEIIMNNRATLPCAQTDLKARERCNLDWLKAFFIADLPDKLEPYYALIKSEPEYVNLARQIMSCNILCSSGQGSADACAANKSYSDMAENFRALPQNRIGSDLSDRLCHAKKQIVLDSFYVRNGNTPRPITSIYKRYYVELLHTKHPLHEARCRGAWSMGFTSAEPPSGQSGVKGELPARGGAKRPSRSLCPCLRPEFMAPEPNANSGPAAVGDRDFHLGFRLPFSGGETTGAFNSYMSSPSAVLPRASQQAAGSPASAEGSAPAAQAAPAAAVQVDLSEIPAEVASVGKTKFVPSIEGHSAPAMPVVNVPHHARKRLRDDDRLEKGGAEQGLGPVAATPCAGTALGSLPFIKKYFKEASLDGRPTLDTAPIRASLSTMLGEMKKDCHANVLGNLTGEERNARS